MQIVLASRSPRRLMLLQGAGMAVEVRPSHIDESMHSGESVQDLVTRLSREKAFACNESDYPVIAADTLVAKGEAILGQPRDLHEAAAMLHTLSGSEHHVLTGVCVRIGKHYEQQAVTTRVCFRHLSEQDIDTYLVHNEVLDKAGAYAVQGGAASFIEAIEGPLDNVIGLPVAVTLKMLARVDSLREKAA
ncbi:MAG TPA: Maf family protein [Mariprofundaceae bacterium]|nr:Maf family protein [Mariprofundaceae bacterium]